MNYKCMIGRCGKPALYYSVYRAISPNKYYCEEHYLEMVVRKNVWKNCPSKWLGKTAFEEWQNKLIKMNLTTIKQPQFLRVYTTPYNKGVNGNNKVLYGGGVEAKNLTSSINKSLTSSTLNPLTSGTAISKSTNTCSICFGVGYYKDNNGVWYPCPKCNPSTSQPPYPPWNPNPIYPPIYPRTLIYPRCPWCKQRHDPNKKCNQKFYWKNQSVENLLPSKKQIEEFHRKIHGWK